MSEDQPDDIQAGLPQEEDLQHEMIDSVIAGELEKEEKQQQPNVQHHQQRPPPQANSYPIIVGQPPQPSQDEYNPIPISSGANSGMSNHKDVISTPIPSEPIMTGTVPGVVASPITTAATGTPYPTHSTNIFQQPPSQGMEGSVPNMPPLGMPPLHGGMKAASMTSDSGGNNIFLEKNSSSNNGSGGGGSTNIFQVQPEYSNNKDTGGGGHTNHHEFDDGIGVIEGNHAYFLASDGHAPHTPTTPSMAPIGGEQWAAFPNYGAPPPLKSNMFMSPSSYPPPPSDTTPHHDRGTSSNRGNGRRVPVSTPRSRKKATGLNSLTVAGPNGTILPITDNGDAKPSTIWYSGNVSLGLEEDQYWLSELQVYLRSNFAEAFSATDEDIAAPMHGRNKPIALGQVGIRCIWCRNVPHTERCNHAVSYPSQISGIYNSVQNMLRNHFEGCASIPEDVRARIRQLQASNSNRGGRKQYWVDSAKRLGLVDTPHGVHFGRNPRGPLPPLSGPSAATSSSVYDAGEDNITGGVPLPDLACSYKQETSLLSQEHTDEIARQREEAYPLVLEEDKTLISDVVYLALEQMEPCKLMDADRVGCYKGQQIGFPGLACRWCVGQAGRGRYFPASETSLSQTTTSQTILNHVINCQHVPIDIRQKLDLMKRSKVGPDGKKCKKPRHGGRKVFFHRLWCRIQGLPIDELGDVEAKIGRQKGAKNKSRSRSSSARKKKKSKFNDDYSDGAYGSDDEPWR